MAVRCELNAARQTVFQIGQKVICASRVTLADEPARHEFGIGVERNPRPNIARALRFHFRRAVLFFRLNKAPDFIALHALAFHVADRAIVELGACDAGIAEQLVDCVEAHV